MLRRDTTFVGFVASGLVNYLALLENHYVYAPQS